MLDNPHYVGDTVLGRTLNAIYKDVYKRQMPEDDVKSAAWLADSRDCMEELITALKEKELLSILTGKQLSLIHI